MTVMTVGEAWAEIAWSLLGFYPNKEQQKPIRAMLGDGTRFIVLCGGERAGKSFTTVGLALAQMGPKHTSTGGYEKQLYWIVGPDYAQARAEFMYAFEALNKAGAIAKVSMPETKTQPWTLTTDWNATLETRTSSDVTKLASFACDGILMVEAAQQNHDVWLKCRGRVADKRGWVIMSGTLEQGLPWYGGLLRRWKAPNKEGGAAFSLPTWSNTAIYPGGFEDSEIKLLRASMDEDYFMERYGAEPRRLKGIVIPEFDPGIHIRELEYVKDAPVELAIDPGKNAYAVLLVQKVGIFAHILDVIYTRGKIVQDVIPLVKASPYWKHVTGGVIDFAGSQEHANKSQVQLWQELAGVNLRYRYLPEEMTRDTVRFRLSPNNSMGEPLVYFNSSLPDPEPAPDGTALHFLTEFRLWKWRTEYRSSEPRKPIDANNHGIKALGYWLVDQFGPSEAKAPPRKAKQRGYWN